MVFLSLGSLPIPLGVSYLFLFSDVTLFDFQGPPLPLRHGLSARSASGFSAPFLKRVYYNTTFLDECQQHFTFFYYFSQKIT